MDQKLLQGMLLAACLCLVVALTMTWVDIAAYGKYRTMAAPAVGALPSRGPSRAAGQMEVQPDTAPAAAVPVAPGPG